MEHYNYGCHFQFLWFDNFVANFIDTKVCTSHPLQNHFKPVWYILSSWIPLTALCSVLDSNSISFGEKAATQIWLSSLPSESRLKAFLEFLFNSYCRTISILLSSNMWSKRKVICQKLMSDLFWSCWRWKQPGAINLIPIYVWVQVGRVSSGTQ